MLKRRIYTIVEVKERELLAKVLFGVKMANKGYSVVIGKKNSLFNFSKYQRPGIFFFKGMGRKNIKPMQELKKFGHKVVLLGDIPRYQVHPEDCIFAPTIKRAMKHCSMSISDFNTQKTIFDPTLKKIANENKLIYIPLDSILCDEGSCSMINEHTILYRDSNHLNIPGSQLVGSYISKELSSQ